MAQTNANVAGLQKETYASAVPELFEWENDFWQRIQARGDFEAVGFRNLRMAKEVSPGGQFRFFSTDGGDLGLGNAPIYDVATLTPLEMLVATQWNKSVEIYTKDNRIAIANAVKKHLANAVREMSTQLDRNLQTNGTAVLGTISTGAGSATVTMTSPFYERLFRENNRYTEYDSTRTTQRTGLATVLSKDPVAHTITFDAALASATNGDVFMAEGLSGATPVGLYGIPYHHSAASTGSWLGLNRATYPQIRTTNVNASSGSLTQTHIRTLMNRIRMFRGEKVWDSGQWEMYTHPQQQQSYEELGFAIQRFDRNEGGDELNMLFDVDKIRMGPFKLLTSANADPTRIDLIDWKNFGRAETVPVGLYDVDGLKRFQTYGTSGGIAASELFYLYTVFQVYAIDPGRGGYISSLAQVPGY